MGVISSQSCPVRIPVMLLHLLQNLHFIEGGLHVVRAAFLNLHGHISFVLEILAKPDSGEVAPSQLLNDDVAIGQNFSNMNWMVASDVIVLNSLILGVMILIDLLQELSELGELVLVLRLLLFVVMFVESVILIKEVCFIEMVPSWNIAI